MPAEPFTPEDPFVAANTWPTLSISTPHPDGGATVRVWCVSPAFAEQVAAMLGEPHMTQLVTAEQREAVLPIVENAPAVFGEATGE